MDWRKLARGCAEQHLDQDRGRSDRVPTSIWNTVEQTAGHWQEKIDHLGEFFAPPLTTHLNITMNYLVLTPDGVGSTLLQRLITMTLYIENQDVMNTHELTNGLKLSNKIAVKDWELEYSQSLKEIAEILLESRKQTTLVSRLAKYHMNSRKDAYNDCLDFYKFLNEFYEKKIMCVRENIFEYAMSWSIRKQSGVLNVYNKKDRSKVSEVSEVDEKYFIDKCKEYVQYINWIETHFPDVEKISYENIVKQSDEIIYKITGYQNTFLDNFGVPLSLLLSNEYDFLKNRLKNNFSINHSKALIRYKILCNKMIEQKIILGMPFKNTTLADKKNQIKNFDTCLKSFYVFAKNHNWIDQSKANYDFWNEKYVC